MIDKKSNLSTETNEIQEFIRQEFNYLTTTYKYVEENDSTIDHFYSEVRFSKNNWILAIVTTAHQKRISIRLKSPEGDFGFLSHYFTISDNQYPKLIDKFDDLEENIKFNFYCLKQYGNDIL